MKSTLCPSQTLEHVDRTGTELRGVFPMVSLSLTMLLASLGTSISNVALPMLAKHFEAPFQHMQWVVIAYLLAVTSLIVVVGRAGDIFGRRCVLVIGLITFSSGSVVCAAAPNLSVLIVGRGVQGLGAAAMMSLSVALMGDITARAQTGRAMGILATMSAIGTALGPSAGGLLLAAQGWRCIFSVLVPLGLATSLLAYRYLPYNVSPGAKGRGVDPIGTVLLAAALAAYALGMTSARSGGEVMSFLLLGIAAAGALAFVWFEARTAHPLVPMDVLRDSIRRDALIANALVATVMMATLVVGPFYLSVVLGLKAVSLGLALAVGPLVSAALSAPGGRAVDRWGSLRVAIAGLGMMGLGLVALAGLPSFFGIAAYLLPIAGLTAGYALFQTANNTAIMRDLPPERRGVFGGVLNLSRNLGLITGASAMGALFAYAAGTSELSAAEPQAVATGMRVTYGVGAALVSIAFVLTRRGMGRSPALINRPSASSFK